MQWWRLNSRVFVMLWILWQCSISNRNFVWIFWNLKVVLDFRYYINAYQIPSILIISNVSKSLKGSRFLKYYMSAYYKPKTLFFPLHQNIYSNSFLINHSNAVQRLIILFSPLISRYLTLTEYILYQHYKIRPKVE